MDLKPVLTIIPLTPVESAQHGQGKYWVCINGIRSGSPLTEELALAKKKALESKKPDDDPNFEP